MVLTKACNNLADSADEDQTAHSLQSDLDQHCVLRQLNLVPALQGLKLWLQRNRIGCEFN